MPVNVRPGNAVTVKFTFWSGWTLPMSASLTAALIWGLVTSISVINAEPVLLVVLLVAAVLLEVELVGPPPISWPTVPFRLATVPLAGATGGAPSNVFQGGWGAPGGVAARGVSPPNDNTQ